MRMATALAALVVVCLALGAEASDLPTAGSPALSSDGASHGWVALRVAGGGAAIIHLPRQAAPRAGSESEDGSVRLATRLPAPPERLGAWEATLYLVFPAEEVGGGRRHRRVVSLVAERGPINGTWVSQTEARLPALPSLPGEGALDGFVGTARGPVALIRAKADTTTRRRYSLLLFDGSEWRSVGLPDQWWGDAEAGPATALRLVAVDSGLALVVVGGGKTGLWTSAFSERTPGDAGSWSPAWTFDRLSFEGPGNRIAPVPDSQTYMVGDHLVYVSRTSDGRTAEVWNPTGAACLLLRRVPDIGEDLGVVPLEPGRLALIWQEYPDEPGARSATKRPLPEPKTRVVEVSVTTGRVLFDGPAKVGPPISQEELKILAVTLVGIMAVVLVFVLKPDAQGAPLALPKGDTLAEPGRRLIAGLIDVAAAALVTSRLTRTPALELLTPTNLLHDPASLEAILMLMGIGFLHCTLGEWLFGRSLGKALTGCEVAHAALGKAEDGTVVVTLERPALWRAAVRNLVRWAIPPLALSGLSAMDHRHRGDTAAGTVVIVRADGEE